MGKLNQTTGSYRSHCSKITRYRESKETTTINGWLWNIYLCYLLDPFVIFCCLLPFNIVDSMSRCRIWTEWGTSKIHSSHDKCRFSIMILSLLYKFPIRHHITTAAMVAKEGKQMSYSYRGQIGYLLAMEKEEQNPFRSFRYYLRYCW